MKRSVPPLLLLAFLAACTADRASYPSLAPRAGEKLGFAEPETTPLVASADPALDARLTGAADRLAGIVAGFDRDAATAGRAAAAARGQAAGSETWLSAQVALASLDDWRAQASALTTDVEQLALERVAALQPAYPALDALQQRVRDEGEREGATIQRLQRSLPAA